MYSIGSKPVKGIYRWANCKWNVTLDDSSDRLPLFGLLPRGFNNRELRTRMAPLLGHSAQECSAGRMTNDLSRFRGLIERIPKSRRYQVTKTGLCTAL